MATHGVIIEKHDGHLIPKELVTGATGKFTSSTGVARVREDGTIDLIRVAQAVDPETFVKDQEKTKDFNVLFYFGSNTSPYMDEDIQPLPLLMMENEPIAVAFLVGEFAEVPPKNPHTKEAHAVMSYLQEKVETLWELAEMDVDKLVKSLDHPGTRKEIMNTLLPNKTGTITILLFNNEIVTYAQNPKRIEGEWGWATESCKTETATAPAPATGEMTMKERIAAAKAAKAAGGTTVPAIAATVVAATEPPKTETAVPIKMRRVGPAPSHMRNEQKRAWWMQKAGVVPEGYKEKDCIIEIPVKDTPQADRPSIPKASPIVNPSMKNAIIEEISYAHMETPDDREKNSTEYPNAMSALGLHMEDTFKWSFGTIYHLITKYPTWGAVLAYDYRNMFLREEALTAELTDPKKPAPTEPAVEQKPLTMKERIAAAKAAKTQAA